MTSHVLARDLADQMGIDRSMVHKIIKRAGLQAIKVRGPETGMQLASALSTDDAAKLMEWRESEGFSGAMRKNGLSANSLYVVAVDPEARPGRIKVGTANNPESRFSDYKTICPQMAALRVYAAPAICEGYLIALADQFGERVGMELFDMGDELDSFLALSDSAMAPFQ